MKIEIGVSDDYAAMEVSGVDLYYGYEVEINDEWCFQMKRDNRVVLTLTKSQIEKKVDRPERLYGVYDYLIAGVGVAIQMGFLAAKG
jgi:hypothetical protein